MNALSVGQGFPAKLQYFDTFGILLENSLQQFFQLFKLHQKGIVTMHGLYLAISHIGIGLGQSFKRLLVFLRRKEQIGVDPDYVDFGVALLQCLESFFPISGYIDGFQQLVHQLIG